MENLKEKLTKAILDAMIADGLLIRYQTVRALSKMQSPQSEGERLAAKMRSEAMNLVGSLLDEAFKEAKDGA